MLTVLTQRRKETCQGFEAVLWYTCLTLTVEIVVSECAGSKLATVVVGTGINGLKALEQAG